MKQVFENATKEQTRLSELNYQVNYQESFELFDKKELDKRFPNRTSLLVIVAADISLAHNQYDSRTSIPRSRPRDAVFI